MPSRREILVGGAAMAVLPGSLLAKASQPATRVNFEVPANACDCHTHIHGDTKEFPMFAGRVYTPEPAMPEEMAQLHKALGMKRVVIVTPSIYGTDNSATLWGMKARGADARGVAVIDDKTPESELDAMGRAGVRGIRLNLATGGGNDPSAGRQRLERAAERMKARGWHVQMYTNLAVISGVKDAVLASPVPVVFDHFGGAQGALGVTQPGFDALLALMRTGKAYVKISAPYRGSTPPDYADMAPLAKALIAANPQRILWGSDWPHPNTSPTAPRTEAGTAPRVPVDDVHVLNLLAGWAPDPALRRTILVDNPAALYRF